MKLQVKRNIPFPQKVSKELTQALSELNAGDYVFVPYEGLTPTIVSNCVSSARLRVIKRGLIIKTIGDRDGRRIWVLKNEAK